MPTREPIVKAPLEFVPRVLAAGEIRNVVRRSSFLFLYAATDSTAVQISFDGSTFVALPLGFTLQDFVFDQVWIKNTSAAPNTITLGFGQAGIRDNRLTFDYTQTMLTSDAVHFPAKAALADATNNPTLSALQTFPMVYNAGTGKWDRLPGTAANGMGVVPSAYQVQKAGSFVRAAAAATYSAGDVVNDNTAGQTLASVANAARLTGGSGIILAARLAVDQVALPTGWTTLRCHLYSDTVGATADNAPFNPQFANRLKKLCFVDFNSWFSAGDQSAADATGINIPFVAAGTSLYWVLETRSALSSNLNQNITFSLDLQILQN